MAYSHFCLIVNSSSAIFLIASMPPLLVRGDDGLAFRKNVPLASVLESAGFAGVDDQDAFMKAEPNRDKKAHMLCGIVKIGKCCRCLRSALSRHGYLHKSVKLTGHNLVTRRFWKFISTPLSPPRLSRNLFASVLVSNNLRRFCLGYLREMSFSIVAR